jgi:hypothetical protein
MTLTILLLLILKIVLCAQIVTGSVEKKLKHVHEKLILSSFITV